MSNYSRDTPVWISDFGSSVKLKSANDTSNFIIGTPGYTAPEVIRGRKYSIACDIWSLGAVMHMLLSFKVPFIDDDYRKYNHNALTEPLILETNKYLR